MRIPRAGVSLLLLLLVVLVAVTGCDSVVKQFDDMMSPSEGPGTDEERREVAAYLEFMDVLDGSDEQAWLAIFEQALNAYEEDPTRERRLRLALAMSRIDETSAGPKETRNMLNDSRALLDDSVNDPAPPLVHKFAQLQLAEIDRRLALYDELRSLRSQLAKAHQVSQTAQRNRTKAEARVRQIDAALVEANAKLEAVMDIERNIGPTGKETFP